MKVSILTVLTLAGLLAASTAMAQQCTGNGPRGQGKGYGGPPQSAEERAARQAACLEDNGGICPQGGPGLGPRDGRGRGHGQGMQHGLRDGTGPRSQDGTCPQGKAPQQRRQR